MNPVPMKWEACLPRTRRRGPCGSFWIYLDTRLRELVPEAEVRENVFLQYTVSLTTLLPVDAESFLAVIRLRNAAPSRLPLVEALIAGIADAAALILVHRDPHFDIITGIKVLRLPGKH